LSWYRLLTTFDICDLDVIARHCQAILRIEQHDHQWLEITYKNHQHQCGTCSTFQLSITSAIPQGTLESSGPLSARTQHASGKMASPHHNCVLLMITTRIVSGDILRLLSPAPLHSVVSEEEVLSFVQLLNACGEEIAGPSCTANHFRLYLDSPPRHPWNRSAPAVFADNYISYHKLTPSADLIDSLVENCLK